MIDLARTYRKQVEAGIEELNHTGKEACVILHLTGEYPADVPSYGQASPVPIATEQ